MTTMPLDPGVANATAEQLIRAGYAALHADNILLAERLFRQAVTADVRSAEGWLGLAATQTGSRHAMCLRWAAYVDGLVRQELPVPRTAPLPQRRTRSARTLWLAPTAAAAILLAVVGRDLAYRDRMLPGLAVGVINVGNLPRTVAEAKVGQWEQRVANRPLKLRIGDQTWQVALGSLLRPQGPKLAQAAFAYGHEPALLARTGRFALAITGYDYQIGTPEVDVVATQSLITQLAQRVKQPSQDAQLERTATGWVVTPEEVGRSIDELRAVEHLRQMLETEAWTAQDTPLVMHIALINEAPARTQAQLEPLRQRLEELRAVPLELEVGGQRWNIDRSMLMERTAAGPQPTVQPSPGLIEQQVAALAGAVEVAPQPSQLVWRGDRVQTIVLGRAGREIEQAAAVEHIVAALASDAPSVVLPMRDVPPPPGEVEQLGLVAELGRGESQFLSYTSPERDANVQVGGNDVDGVLLPPGAVFSFTRTVGSITVEKGYRWGEAIEAGALVPSLGGGICQVSTTVFRAAFWSGLEIVERSNHSWRLPWYEVDAPPGMDATIALGGPDLKFRNNTAKHILIKVETDLARKRQTVIVYGTPDGRKVEMQAQNSGTISIQRNVIDGTGRVSQAVFVSPYTQ